MKCTITYFLLALFVSIAAFAKDGQKQATLSAANYSVQFIENKGQVTDQHGTVRNDIDAKIEANGVVMFVGNGEWHYQWTKSTESKVEGRKSGAGGPAFAEATAGDGGEEKSQVEIYRMDVKLVGANKNAEVIFEEPTGYYENYYLAHTGEDGVTARGYGRVIYKDIYPNIDLVFYTAPMSGASIPPPSAKLTPPPAGDNTLSLSPAGGGGEVRAGGGTLAQEIHNESSTARGDRGVGSRPSFAEAAAGNVKYDFIIRPGGNPADIRLRYEGATELKLLNGALMATTPFGTITEEAPYSYNAATKEPVVSGYKLSGNTLSFATGSYTGTLVIDPYLRWGTYFGGSSTEHGNGVVTSPDGYVYIGGATHSPANIATTGAYKTTLVNSTYFDGFIAKFDDSCNRLWTTYYGGGQVDEIAGIVVDKSGNIYAVGITLSDTGIATSGVFQSFHSGYPIPLNRTSANRNGFVAKFSPAGQRIWGTYYGGGVHTYTELDGIACDGQNVYVTGNSSDPYGLASSGAFRDTGLGVLVTTYNSLLIKFSSSGQRLWATYVTDNNVPRLYVVACDAAGNVYVGGDAGTVNNTDLLSTTGAHQQLPAGGVSDGILAKFSPAGFPLWCTYYGGTSTDVVLGITCDNANNVYITGQTQSTAGIATTGAHQSSIGNVDAFLVKFNSAGARQWGTYYGGNNGTWGYGLAVCPNGRIYLAGRTSSSSGIAGTGGFKTSLAGDQDGFLAEFTPGGQRLYGTYYGGAGFENVAGIATSAEGIVYMCGETSNSSSGIAAGAAHQATSGGGFDAMLIAWFTDTTAYIKQPYTDTVWCPGDTVRIVYGVNQPFGSGNTFTVQLSNDTGAFISPVTIGSKAATENDTITCVIPLNTPPGAKYRIRITGTTPVRISQDNDWDIRIKAIPTAFGNASNSPVCTGDTLRLLGSSDSTNITWAWTGPGSFSSGTKDTFIANAQLSDSGKYILKATLNSTGCSLTDTTTVEMRPTPDKPVAGSNSPVCETLPLTLSTSSNTSGVTYSWVGPSYSSSTQNPTVTASAGSSHAGDYISTVTLNGCSNKDTATVVVLPKPSKPTAAAPNSPLCQRQDLQLTATTVTGASYTWYGPSAYTASVQNPVRQYVQLADAGTYYVYATLNGCISDTDSVAVVVNTDPFVNVFPTPGATICPGRQVVFTAVPTNGGTSPSYAWYRNGIPTSSTGLTYTTSSLTNGDIVYCLMTSTGTCATPFIDTSNAIPMTVLPVKIPKVSISADAGPSLFPNEPINFTATYSDAGANPTFQWRRSGKHVQGATGDVWGANANFLADGDEICVLINSSYECPLPDTVLSNCITLEIRVGVDDVATNNGSIKIYPNPVRDVLYVEGAHSNAIIDLVDVMGRTCAGTSPLPVRQAGYPPSKGGIVEVDVRSLVPGVYVVRVDGVVAGRAVIR